MQCTFSWRSWAIFCIVFVVAGCTGNSPDQISLPELTVSEGAAAPITPAASPVERSSISNKQNGRSGESALPPGEHLIIGFRKSHVTLYADASSNGAERVPTAALQLPLSSRLAVAGNGRLQVQTVQGPRWVPMNEVILDPSSAATKASRQDSH